MKTDFNASFINSSNTIIKVIPSENIDQDINFDTLSLNLTW